MGQYLRLTEDGDIRVISFGKDKKENSPDDVKDNFKKSDIEKVPNEKRNAELQQLHGLVQLPLGNQEGIALQCGCRVAPAGSICGQFRV